MDFSRLRYRDSRIGGTGRFRSPVTAYRSSPDFVRCCVTLNFGFSRRQSGISWRRSPRGGEPFCCVPLRAEAAEVPRTLLGSFGRRFPLPRPFDIFFFAIHKRLNYSRKRELKFTHSALALPLPTLPPCAAHRLFARAAHPNSAPIEFAH